MKNQDDNMTHIIDPFATGGSQTNPWKLMILSLNNTRNPRLILSFVKIKHFKHPTQRDSHQDIPILHQNHRTFPMH